MKHLLKTCLAVGLALFSASVPAAPATQEFAEVTDASLLYKLPLEDKGAIDGMSEPLGPGTAVIVERRSQKLPWAFVRAGNRGGWIPLAKLDRFEKRVVTPKAPPSLARRTVAPLPPSETERLLKALREEKLE